MIRVQIANYEGNNPQEKAYGIEVTIGKVKFLDMAGDTCLTEEEARKLGREIAKELGVEVSPNIICPRLAPIGGAPVRI